MYCDITKIFRLHFKICDKMRSRLYKKHHATDRLAGHDRPGLHVLCEYTMKGPYNPLEFYILKNNDWWFRINRRICIFHNGAFELRKIRCKNKYEMNNRNHNY